jgi:hypothetical protein
MDKIAGEIRKNSLASFGRSTPISNLARPVPPVVDFSVRLPSRRGLLSAGLERCTAPTDVSNERVSVDRVRFFNVGNKTAFEVQKATLARLNEGGPLTAPSRMFFREGAQSGGGQTGRCQRVRLLAGPMTGSASNLETRDSPMCNCISEV